ncbi:MAG: histidine phosphatase family protein [Syntrophales bacterium]|nr:histidine phosphatase family protein [Syntrophales bacterium]
MEDVCTRLYLLRHGQVVNFSEGKYNGHRDVDITDIGVRQMEAMAKRLRNEHLAGVYCSDLLRAKRGAEIIAAEHGLRPQAYSTLRELNIGRWEGLTPAETEEQFPGALDKRRKGLVDYRIPGGESLRDLSKRVLPALRGILDVNRGGNVVLVAHGGVNRVILADAMNLALKYFYSIEQNYGCLNIIDYFTDCAVVKLMNAVEGSDIDNKALA